MQKKGVEIAGNDADDSDEKSSKRNSVLTLGFLIYSLSDETLFDKRLSHMLTIFLLVSLNLLLHLAENMEITWLH